MTRMQSCRIVLHFTVYLQLLVLIAYKVQECKEVMSRVIICMLAGWAWIYSPVVVSAKLLMAMLTQCVNCQCSFISKYSNLKRKKSVQTTLTPNSKGNVWSIVVFLVLVHLWFSLTLALTLVMWTKRGTVLASFVLSLNQQVKNKNKFKFVTES